VIDEGFSWLVIVLVSETCLCIDIGICLCIGLTFMGEN
jgi:hypothetical protein